MTHEAIDTDRVIDHLNATVETEGALVDAFEAVILVTPERQARLRLEDYRCATQCHWDLATVFIARYGSIPEPKETEESVAEDIEAALMGGPRKLRQLHRLRELSALLLLARSNWEALRLVAEAVEEESIAAQAAEVVVSKDSQLRWLKEYLLDTGPKALFSRRLTVGPKPGSIEPRRPVS
jgi:hypothetical protein